MSVLSKLGSARTKILRRFNAIDDKWFWLFIIIAGTTTAVAIVSFALNPKPDFDNWQTLAIEAAIALTLGYYFYNTQNRNNRRRKKIWGKIAYDSLHNIHGEHISLQRRLQQVFDNWPAESDLNIIISQAYKPYLRIKDIYLPDLKEALSYLHELIDQELFYEVRKSTKDLNQKDTDSTETNSHTEFDYCFSYLVELLKTQKPSPSLDKNFVKTRIDRVNSIAIKISAFAERMKKEVPSATLAS